MKISKQKLLLFAISIILFFIPFFWLKLGQMDLGGDSSRLYLYDPISYLFTNALYIISPSNFGSLNLNASFPYVSFLIILKSIIQSPTNLIALSYGMSLSFAFLFTTLSIAELIGDKKRYYGAIVGGLLYAFSPALINGWNHVLITYNQIFLNPLVFYFLLKYFKSTNMRYIFISILVAFVFSPNFSFGGAPGIFSFYPLSILFLILYTKLIHKKPIVLRHIVIGFLLILGIEAFNLIPQFLTIFSKGNAFNATIFSNSGKFDRGLGYFSAIAPVIKVSINLFMLHQMEVLSSFSKVFMILPFVIVVSLFFTKKRTILLTIFFFLITLFFASANITDLGFSIYKSLFSLPGFSMFRNFNGQWIDTYVFFYSILFGQALAVLLGVFKKPYTLFLTFFLVGIILIDARSLIKGNIINQHLWQSDVKGVLRIDPDYALALSYIKSLPIDARIVTLPLTDPGYQIFSDTHGGAYVGPSSIAYLAGKKDFSGYDEFLDYKSLIVKFVLDNKSEDLKQLLGFLNVKYIFYNADPNVYDKFPTFPYQATRLYFPENQISYENFIKSLQLKEIKNINNKFFVYEIPDTYFFPQIYATKNSIQLNTFDTEIQTPLSIEQDNNRISVFNSLAVSYSDIFKITPNPKIIFNETMTDVTDKSILSLILNNMKEESKLGFGFASWRMDSSIYPFIVSREKKAMAGYRNVDDAQVDQWMQLTEKRISELSRWGYNTPILGNVKKIDELSKSWQEPTIYQAIVLKKYNYWEICMVRYQKSVFSLIDAINSAGKADPTYRINKQKDRIKKRLILSKGELSRSIGQSTTLTQHQKTYLFTLARDMFDEIDNRLAPTIPPLDTVTYNLSDLQKGDYDIFIDKKSLQAYNGSQLRIIANGKDSPLNTLEQNNNWFKFSNFTVNEKNATSLSLSITPQINLIANTKWEATDSVQFGEKDFVSFTQGGLRMGESGLVRKIENWNESSYYVISFDYQTFGNVYKLSFFEKTKIHGSKLSTFLQSDLRSSDWKTYQAVVSSDEYADWAAIKISKQEDDGFGNVTETLGQNKEIDIKNLSVIQIPNPKIIFRKINTPRQNEKPDITFTRINATKYMIKIHNATTPYTLVLNNQFDKNWILLDPNRQTRGVSAFIERIIAWFGDTIIGKHIRVVYSSNVFLDQDIFNAWGMLVIAQDKHFPVNGYGNAWYIEPKDMQGKTDYTLVLEMSSQRLLYAGLVVSALFFLLIFSLLLRNLLLSKR